MESGAAAPPRLSLVSALPPGILGSEGSSLDPVLITVQPSAFSRVSLRPGVIKSTFAYENLLKMGQNFVPGRPLPDAPQYVPLTSHEKFDRFVRSTHSTDTLLGGVFDSLYSQATGTYSGFGSGLQGYGKHYEATLLGAEAGAFFGRFLFPTLLHQDRVIFRRTKMPSPIVSLTPQAAC